MELRFDSVHKCVVY